MVHGRGRGGAWSDWKKGLEYMVIVAQGGRTTVSRLVTQASGRLASNRSERAMKRMCFLALPVPRDGVKMNRTH